MSTISIENKIDSFFNNSKSSVFDGLSYSSDSLFIFSKKIKKKLIVVESNNEGKRIYKELKVLGSHKNNSEIIFIPGTEEMPYDMVDSDKFLSSSKNLNLIKLLKSTSDNITVITTIKNLRKKIIPKDVLLSETIFLKENENLDINTIRKNLV